MEIYLNELSLSSNFLTTDDAKTGLANILSLYKKLYSSQLRGFRVPNNFYEHFLTADYNMNNWLNDSGVSRSLKDLLLSITQFPYIEISDDIATQEFLSVECRVQLEENDEFHNSTVEGLATAYIKKSIGISLLTNQRWSSSQIKLNVQNQESVITASVRHASTIGHAQAHLLWLESLEPLVLMKSTIEPDDKTIKLRDDHGKATLEQLAQRLMKSEYTLGVINSLPFNPTETHPVRKIYPDGKIEIVMINTDKGLGMIIKTTGRNFRETSAIADILMDKYLS